MLRNKLNLEVRTSDEEWLQDALECHFKKIPYSINDDDHIGLTKEDICSPEGMIIKALKSKKITWDEMVKILHENNVCAAGFWLVAAALSDPSILPSSH